jgi:hypothetical protein
VQHRAYTGRASTADSKPSYYATNTCVIQKWNITLSHYSLYSTLHVLIYDYFSTSQ